MIAQSLKMALKSILSNKLRSFLTMLGIIIGVVSLVVLVSLVNGATASITDSINALGNNMLNVTISDDHDHPVKLSALSEFTEDSLFDSIAPSAGSTMTAASAYEEENVQITGTTASYLGILGLTLESGRFLMKPDLDNHSNVAVINSDFASEIMGRKDVVGESVRLNGRKFLIIGVLKENESSSNAAAGNTYAAYIPYTSLIRLSENTSNDITSFCLSVNGNDMDAAKPGWKTYF